MDRHRELCEWRRRNLPPILTDAWLSQTYTIWLVADADPNENDSAYGWTKFAGLGTGLEFSSLDPSFTWTVPSNVSVNG